VINSFFIRELTIASSVFVDMPQLEDLDLSCPHFPIRRCSPFLQPHFFALFVKAPCRWIGGLGAVPWPPRSTVLTPLYFHSWGYAKDHTYSERGYCKKTETEPCLCAAHCVSLLNLIQIAFKIRHDFVLSVLYAAICRIL
jgi:hypothetical protein